MCKCRLFKTSKKDYNNIGKHHTFMGIYTCKMCKNPKQKWSFHGNDGFFAGASLECKACSNYILYFDFDNSIDLKHLIKEEFYIDTNIFIMFADKTYSVLIVNKNLSFNIPYFDFEDIDHLKNKIKTYITFS